MARPKANGLLTREAILGRDDLKRQRVKVPEWGGEVLIQTMTASDRDLWEQRQFVGEDGAVRRNVRANLVAATAVDEDGNALFTEADVEALGRKSAAALSRLYDVAAKLNRLLAGDLKELEKN